MERSILKSKWLEMGYSLMEQSFRIQNIMKHFYETLTLE